MGAVGGAREPRPRGQGRDPGQSDGEEDPLCSRSSPGLEGGVPGGRTAVSTRTRRASVITLKGSPPHTHTGPHQTQVASSNERTCSPRPSFPSTGRSRTAAIRPQRSRGSQCAGPARLSCGRRGRGKSPVCGLHGHCGQKQVTVVTEATVVWALCPHDILRLQPPSVLVGLPGHPHAAGIGGNIPSNDVSPASPRGRGE